MVAKGEVEGGDEELLFNGYRVSVREDEKVLETDGKLSCTAVSCTECHRPVHLKMVKLVNFMYILPQFKIILGTSLVVHWLRLHTSTAGGTGSIPVQGTKIPHASQPKNQNIKKKQYCNKFSKDFKNGPYEKNLKINKF